jgi:hypothetical protein
MFVINEAGEMYTRLADFDTTGCDPMWFKYTYVPYKSGLPGTDYFSNLNEWGLPAEDWRPQPPIPLTGKAAITRHITILQNCRGNGARELRAAGLNEAGDTGYWTKAIFDDDWTFKPVPLYFREDAVLEAAASAESGARAGGPLAERGPSPDKQYHGYHWNGNEKENGWEYAIPNFNMLEGDCDFRISRRGETCTLKLYPVEMWSYLKRNYLPGRTGSPKMFLATLEIPENAFDRLSAEFTAELIQKYAKHDKKLFQYTLAALNHYIILRDSGAPDSVLFLTDGEVSNQYTEFRQTWLVENFEELRRYYSPELIINRNDAITHAGLIRKIESNETFRDELKYQIRSLKWSQLTAFKITADYLPAHYSVLMSPLRFVDVPKIRTVVQFGDRIVLENSSYVYSTSNVRIWAYEKILELLEVRLRCYNELAKEFSGTDSNASNAAEITFPYWYSENISAYWDIAGLPRVIPGTFFSPGRTQIPAVLSFVPSGKEPELFGWYFSIGEPVHSARADNSFSIFIDPLKSPRAIYSRKSRTPEQKTLQLNGILYIKSGTNSPIGQGIIDRVLKPFINETSRGIKVRIRFDGRTLEIREYPATHSNPLIFRGDPSTPHSSLLPHFSVFELQVFTSQIVNRNGIVIPYNVPKLPAVTRRRLLDKRAYFMYGTNLIPVLQISIRKHRSGGAGFSGIKGLALFNQALF